MEYRHFNRGDEQKDGFVYDRQTLEVALNDTFQRLDLSHGHIAESVDQIKNILAKSDLSYDIPHSSNILLVGGGSGTAVAGRSLFRAGVNNFAMLANTGEMGRDPQTDEALGGGMIFEEIPLAIDVMDIVKQSIHATPEELKTDAHHLLEQQRSHIRLGYVILEALRQIKGDPQKAIDFLNYWMQNPYRVMPSTTDRAELFLDMHGTEISSNDYARRPDPYDMADRTIMRPTAALSEHARQAIAQAKTIVVGPGDVYFSVLPHWGVKGFQEELEANTQANIIVVVNLTARKYDTTDFKVTDYLDLYGKFLPQDRSIVAVINNGQIPVDNRLIDNIPEQNMYGRYALVRDDITGQQVSTNNQLMHDENNFGRVLRDLIPVSP